jgi:hypothetical protein
MIEPCNDLHPTGADLVTEDAPDSLASVITTLAYLRASWGNRSAEDVNSSLDSILVRLADLQRSTLDANLKVRARNFLDKLRQDARKDPDVLVCLEGLSLAIGQQEIALGSAVSAAYTEGLIDYDNKDVVRVTPFGEAVALALEDEDVTRRCYVMDNSHYTVRRGDLHPELGNRRRWDLLRHTEGHDSAVTRDSYVFVEDSLTIDQVALRFGLTEAHRV